MKSKSIFIILLVVLLLTSCAPAEEIIATNTVVPTSITTLPSPTPTMTVILTVMPTPTPVLEEIHFYELKIEYLCSSQFCSIEFLNPDLIQTITEIIYEEDVKVSFDYPFINIDRHGDEIIAGNYELLTFKIGINVDDIGKTLQIQSRHGSNGGSKLSFFLNESNTLIQIDEFDHLYRNPSNPDENPKIFKFSLGALRSYSPQSKNILISSSDKMVWAVYYPWIAWKQDLECTDHPLLNYQYNDDGSRTRETYMEEIETAKRAGIDGFFISWFNDPISNHNIQLILDVAEELDFKIAIYLESLLDGSVNPEIENWIQYAIETFGRHPAYMQVNNKPVIMIYGYLEAPFSRWKALFENLQMRGHNAAYFPASYNLADLDISTGLHQYILLDKSNLVALYSTLARSVHLSSGANERKYFVATVSPGFNNCPYNIDNPPYEIPRENGSFYENQFNAAINSDPDWIMITSWNEFGESTHVQPSENYGEYYLEITNYYLMLRTKRLQNRIR